MFSPKLLGEQNRVQFWAAEAPTGSDPSPPLSLPGPSPGVCVPELFSDLGVAKKKLKAQISEQGDVTHRWPGGAGWGSWADQ